MWGKELYFDSTQVHANADLDSLAPRFAVEAREAIQEHLTALFAPEPAQPETPSKASVHERFANHFQRTPLHFCQSHSPLLSPRYRMRNLRKTMLPGMTGLQREVGRISEKPMASIGELLTFGSVPLIQMPHPCASREEEFTWATTHTTSWMEESVASVSQYWSCQGR